jgi:predicted small secreted protein
MTNQKENNMKKIMTLCIALLFCAAIAGCNKEDKKGEAGESGGSRLLGTTQMGSYSVKVTQDSDYKPGGKTKYMIKPSGGQGEPTAVRAWVGNESGEGSLKAKAGYDAADGDYDAFVEVPANPSPDAKLWVEIEAGGKKEKASFPAHK